MQLEIKTEELRKYKLFVATPCYGGSCEGVYARSLSDLLSIAASNGIQVQLYMLFNKSLITRARAYAADEFIRSDATHLLFLDSDIGFNAQDVFAMWQLMINNPDQYDIMGAPYPKKCIAWEKIKLAVDKGFADKNPNQLDDFVGDFVFNPLPGVTSISLLEPAEVLEIGTGFMMIQRKVFTLFDEHYPQYRYRPDHVRTEHFDGSREIMMYFQAEIDRPYLEKPFRETLEAIANGSDADPATTAKAVLAKADAELASCSKRYLSEDYLFCQLVRKAGGRIWFCPWMRTQHVGKHIYGGSLHAMSAIQASATADVSLLKKGNKGN